MQELIAKSDQAIKLAASTVGASAVTSIKAGVPAAEYNQEVVDLAREAIRNVLGESGLLDPITTPGGEDFHIFVQEKPNLKAGYIGLGCNLTPGLHDPTMKFDRAALRYGVDILSFMIKKLLT